MQVDEHYPLRGQRLKDIHEAVSPENVLYYRTTEIPICPPPCECPDCQNSFYTVEEQQQDRFTYAAQTSETQAKGVLKDFVTRLSDDRQFLRKICDDNGDRLLSRWKKKGRNQRATWLLNAEPDLYQQQWFIPRYCNTSPQWKDARRYRKSFLLPYLDVETLQNNPEVLLGLLHNRTHYPPDDWIPFDSKELTNSWALGLHDVDFCSGCVVMHGPRFGELTPWEPGAAHRSDIIGYPRARLIMEAQSNLFAFLRRVVNQILDGVDLDSPSSSQKWQELTRRGFKKSGDVALWSQYTHQAFSPPPRLNLEDLVSQSKARLDAVGDHLWLLQTDSSYYRQYIRQISQNEVIKTSSQAATSYIMITQEMYHDVKVYWYWTWVHDESRNALHWCSRLRDNIHRGQALPRKYDEALGALELLLVNGMHVRSKHLQAIIPQRPGFRHLWKFDNDVKNGVLRMRRIGNSDQTEVFNEDPLEWCLVQLQGPPDSQTRFDHAMLFNFLDDHLSKCTFKDRARLDKVIFDKLADYAAIHELLVAIRMHRPQNTNRDAVEVFKTDDRTAWRHRNWDPEIPFEDFQALAKQLATFHEIPPMDGQKNQVMLQRFDSMNDAMGKFWSDMRRRCRTFLSRPKNGLSSSEVEHDLKILSLRDTPEFSARVLAERRSMEACIAESEQQVKRAQLSAQTSRNQDHSAGKPQSHESKAKVKTRKESAVTAARSTDEEKENEPSPSEESQEKWTLAKKTSFDILMMMFPTSSEESSKTVEWDAFVHAMTDAGFLARNGGGSAVIFQGGKDPVKRGKIIFHKPHPVAKLDSIMLRSMGKRMKKWFGWGRGSFALESAN